MESTATDPHQQICPSHTEFVTCGRAPFGTPALPAPSGTNTNGRLVESAVGHLLGLPQVSQILARALPSPLSPGIACICLELLTTRVLESRSTLSKGPLEAPLYLHSLAIQRHHSGKWAQRVPPAQRASCRIQASWGLGHAARQSPGLETKAHGGLQCPHTILVTAAHNCTHRAGGTLAVQIVTH